MQLMLILMLKDTPRWRPENSQGVSIDVRSFAQCFWKSEGWLKIYTSNTVDKKPVKFYRTFHADYCDKEGGCICNGNTRGLNPLEKMSLALDSWSKFYRCQTPLLTSKVVQAWQIRDRIKKDWCINKLLQLQLQLWWRWWLHKLHLST